MGIQRLHTHPPERAGDLPKVCYGIRTHHPLRKQGTFSLGSRVLTGGFMPYTGSWYFYDEKTGHEVGRLDSSLSDVVEGMRLSALVEDPECLRPSPTPT